jgi:hypothetical protein
MHSFRENICCAPFWTRLAQTYQVTLRYHIVCASFFPPPMDHLCSFLFSLNLHAHSNIVLACFAHVLLYFPPPHFACTCLAYPTTHVLPILQHCKISFEFTFLFLWFFKPQWLFQTDLALERRLGLTL